MSAGWSPRPPRPPGTWSPIPRVGLSGARSWRRSSPTTATWAPGASVGGRDLDIVSELRLRPHTDADQPGEDVVRELAEHDEDADLVEQRQLPRQVRQTRVALDRRRLVVGRRATDGGRDVGAVQLQ